MKIKDVIKLAEEIDKSVLNDDDKIKVLMMKIYEYQQKEDIEKIIDDTIVEMQIMEELN